MTLNTQLMTIVVMTLMGLEFAAAYDTYMRLFRRTFSKKWILLVCDMNFMLVQAFCLFYLLYQVNHGEIRIYIVIALICGYAIYQSLFRMVYRSLLENLIKLFQTIYRVISKLIFILLVKPIKFVVKVLVAMIRLLKKILYNFFKALYSIAKRGVVVVILVTYKLFSPMFIIKKIIPIKYRIKTKMKFEKILLEIKNKIKNKVR